MITPVDAKYRFSYRAGQFVPAGAGENEKAESDFDTSAIRRLQGSVKDQAVEIKGCKTWASRKYKDRSYDPSVSFQTPTSVATEQAASAVISHEQEHVRNNERKADRQGMKATSFVQIHAAICPECGRSYISGGTTTTYYSNRPQMPGTDENDAVKIDIFA